MCKKNSVLFLSILCFFHLAEGSVFIGGGQGSGGGNGGNSSQESVIFLNANGLNAKIFSLVASESSKVYVQNFVKQYLKPVKKFISRGVPKK